MEYQISKLHECHIPFVAGVYEENRRDLHGVHIPVSEWLNCLWNDADPDEANFIISANGENAAWLKLNGILSNKVYISMLVVSKKYQRIGIGSYAIRFAELFAKENGKTAVMIQTTTDNIPAQNCYEKQGYRVEKHMKYTVGDGIERDGILFCKGC